MSTSPKISSFTIIVTFLCVALTGLAFIPLLPIKLSPSRTLPRLTVSYNMPSNSARVIEMEVTSRLESMLARIKGIKEINSTSGNGWGYVTLELDKHTNIDAARFEASTIVRQTWPSLPDGLSYPILEMSRPDDKESGPFMTYTLNAAATPIFIQRFAEDQIKPRLAGIPGIYRIDVRGATPMEWRLEYDSRQLVSLGITTNDIQNAIAQYYNKEFLGTGNVNTNEQEEWIRLALIPEDVREGFEASHITVTSKEGKLIRLDQLLKVTRQEEAPQSYYRINGLNSIYLSIRAEETANQLELAKQVKEEMEHIRQLLPQGYEVHTSYDATEFIQNELDKIYVRTGLTILILLLFVLLITRNVRYLFLIVVSLSVNLCIAVIFFYLAKLEMQLYSLAGVTISLSLVIDNTIVMTDHIRNRHNRKAFLSILTATLTTIGALVIISSSMKNTAEPTGFCSCGNHQPGSVAGDRPALRSCPDREAGTGAKEKLSPESAALPETKSHLVSADQKVGEQIFKTVPGLFQQILPCTDQLSLPMEKDRMFPVATGFRIAGLPAPRKIEMDDKDKVYTATDSLLIENTTRLSQARPIRRKSSR